MKVFNLPDLGEGLAEAEIHEWHVKEGDEVKLDQTIVSMETAKAVVDVPAPCAGKILKLYGKPGDVIATGSPLVEFVAGDALKQPDTSTVAGRLQAGDTVLTENPTGVAIQRVAAVVGVRALPAARILANKLHVDLAQVTGSGLQGQVTVQDVEQFSKRLQVEGLVPLKGVRKAMAQAMVQSHQAVVPVTLVDDADIHAWQKEEDITLRIIRAIIQACNKEPALNAWFDGYSFSCKRWKEVNLGIALDAKDGLFVPVIKDVARYDAVALRAKINTFKQQALDRTLPPEELQGATFTLSNFGVFAGRYASPIIVPPMVAILAVGKLHQVVVAEEGGFVSHRMMPLSLTFDHRAATGGEAARFLQALIEDLQCK